VAAAAAAAADAAVLLSLLLEMEGICEVSLELNFGCSFFSLNRKVLKKASTFSAQTTNLISKSFP